MCEYWGFNKSCKLSMPASAVRSRKLPFSFTGWLGLTSLSVLFGNFSSHSSTNHFLVLQFELQVEPSSCCSTSVRSGSWQRRWKSCLKMQLHRMKALTLGLVWIFRPIWGNVILGEHVIVDIPEMRGWRQSLKVVRIPSKLPEKTRHNQLMMAFLMPETAHLVESASESPQTGGGKVFPWNQQPHDQPGQNEGWQEQDVWCSVKCSGQEVSIESALHVL